jgi:hypothetical protein
MGGYREGRLGNAGQPGSSQERRGRKLDALRDALTLPTTLKELTGEIRRFNNNLEDLHLDPITIQEGIEIARDLRTMLAGSLGYRVKESSVPLPGSRPTQRR